MDVIYLDHNASTGLPRELLKEVESLVQRSVASPSSLHRLGRVGRRIINESTESVARLLNCGAHDIYWTSGASEANSWVYHSVALSARKLGRLPRILLSSIEHESVLLAARAVQAQGGEIGFVRALADGRLDLENFSETLGRDPSWDLVSVMHSNNETGVLQPIEKVASICRKKNIPLHVDAVQSLGKLPLDVSRLAARYITFSGHKIGAPKGVGFVVVKEEGQLLWPMIHGKQQKALRGGTENPLGVGLVGLLADRIADSNHFTFRKQLSAWHEQFEREIKQRVPGAIIHGESAPRLGNTTFVGFAGVDGDGILMNLDLAGVCASSGSACTSGSLDPSHVLLAMGCDKAIARSSVRFSSGEGTSSVEFEKVLEVLPGIVERVRKVAKCQ